MSKSERVKVSRPGVKGVLAFFLLPQFWRCFGHFSHIGPTFVRTLALMLEQAGLLPINHPATRYNGTSPDGKKITIRAVMGEAWFHLRTRKDVGVYQWSMFGSIVMMFAIFIGAIAMATIYVVSGSVAQAQIFNLATPTDLTTVPNYGGANGFDTRDPATIAGTSGDLAIGILDKVLRQGATGRGGPLQDGIATMYGTYSSAVLIIAAILVFWSIVSIVVDSARTGQFGGGRHNMVWTPIRFVFALGLLVPIGGGFSSGQMLVMKLAELGSNLGTNMWNTYITGTISGDMLISELKVKDPNEAVSPYINAIVCMKKNNVGVEVSKGTAATNYATLAIPTPISYPPVLPPGGIDGDLVIEYPDMAAYTNGEDRYSIDIGTASNHSKCGSYTFANPNANFLNGTATVGVPIPPGATGTAAYYPPDPVAQFKKAVRLAEINAMASIRADMDLYGCAIAGKEQADAPANYNKTCPSGVNYSMVGPVGPLAAPLDYLNPVPVCVGPYAGGWGGDYPPKECRELIAVKYAVILHNAIYAPVVGAKAIFLDPYVAGAGPGTLIGDAGQDGWAGMGAWYYNIAKINRVAANSQNAEGGGSDGDAGEEDACFWPIEDTFLCTVINIAANIWNNAADTERMNEAFSSGGFVKVALNLLQDGDSVLLTSLGQWGQNTHPIAQISATGEAILNKSLNMYNAMMIMSLLAGIPFVGGIMEAIMAGPIGGLMGMLASFGMLPAITLLYYVPLIPWIRVMFAVLAWIVSVVEAVTTMPIVALAHLRTDGEGLAGPMAQSAYIAWLNLLLRPGLTVIGFVMGGLVFQAMVLYSNDTFTNAMSSMGTGGFGIVDQVMNTYMYVMVMYALVNASFKLVDIIPNSTMGWLGGPGAQSFEGADEIIRSGINEVGSEFARTASDFAGNSVRHYFREDNNGNTNVSKNRAGRAGKLGGVAGAAWNRMKGGA